jgi:hypothetical protein
MLTVNGGQGGEELSGKRIFALGKAGEAIDDEVEFFVADAPEDGLEGAPGLAGLHRAVSGVGVGGVFGDGLDEEVANPELEFEGGQVEVVLVLLGEVESLLGGFDDGKVHTDRGGNPVREAEFSRDESCGPCS